MLRSASRLLRRAISVRQSCPTHQLDEARSLKLQSSAQILQSAKNAHITGMFSSFSFAYGYLLMLTNKPSHAPRLRFDPRLGVFLDTLFKIVWRWV
jgi:hypothetical protein